MPVIRFRRRGGTRGAGFVFAFTGSAIGASSLSLRHCLRKLVERGLWRCVEAILPASCASISTSKTDLLTKPSGTLGDSAQHSGFLLESSRRSLPDSGWPAADAARPAVCLLHCCARKLAPERGEMLLLVPECGMLLSVQATCVRAGSSWTRACCRGC